MILKEKNRAAFPMIPRMENRKNKYLVIIAGPTAIGKTSTGISIAKHFGSPVISADSRQIFKELKIGTAVPSDEQLLAVRHYFVRNISIHDNYNASKYEFEVNQLLSELFEKHSVILLVGGSGLYIDAVCWGIDDLPEIDPEIRKKVQQQFENEGIESLRRDLKLLDPVSYQKVDLRNHKRIQKALEVTLMTGRPYSSFLTAPEKKRNYQIIRIALDMDRTELYNSINQRILSMMENGLENEARSVYPYRNINALNTVGYKELFLYFDGKISRDEAISTIQSNTRKYARKQITWFRKEQSYVWFHPSEINKIIGYIENQIEYPLN
jgi:tRNA dimethylallyltransferase